MNTVATHALVAKLGALQHELETLGYRLDCEGSREAADVAVASSVRIRNLIEDYAGDILDVTVRTTIAGSSTV